LAKKVTAQFGHERLSAGPARSDVIAANLTAVIRLKEKCNGIPFISVLIPSGVPRTPNGDLWLKFIEQLPDDLDLRFVLQDPAFFLDGSHLSAKGHQLVGDRIFNEIRKLLEPPSSSTNNRRIGNDSYWKGLTTEPIWMRSVRLQHRGVSVPDFHTIVESTR
jgi:hypothetical protein